MQLYPEGRKQPKKRRKLEKRKKAGGNEILFSGNDERGGLEYTGKIAGL